MSEELQEMFRDFLYHLALEVGIDTYGDSVEAEKLYRKVASEMSQLFILKEELPDWVGNKLSEFASSFGFTEEE